VGGGSNVSGSLEPIPREKILAAYRAGPDAIVSLIQYLQDMYEVQLRGLQRIYEAKLAELTEQIKQLQARLHTDSHNSSKPPSSDGPAHRPYVKRKKSTRKPGGQSGHEGTTLKRVSCPDSVVPHPVERCSRCGTSLRYQAAEGYEAHQVFDVPPIRVQVTEHRAEIKSCPVCGRRCVAEFPSDAQRVVQYGVRLCSIAVYLKDHALIPFERNAQLIEDLFGVHLSAGTLANMEQECAQQLQPIEEQLRDAVRTAEVVHFDETGIRIEGKLAWLHSASTANATYYRVHARRGVEAIEAIGILPAFGGIAVHDAWASYFGYEALHALCNAHHVRELTFLWEEQHQRWAKRLAEELLHGNLLVQRAKERGQHQLAPATMKKFEQRYEKVVLTGMRANPPPPPTAERRRGRKRKSKAQNLLVRLWSHREDVLRFAHDFRAPFTNNRAEQDLRMMKVQQKISGTFRSWTGAEAFALIRSYLSTARKRGMNVIEAISAVFAGAPSILLSSQSAE
jgi:transposase